MKEKVIVAFNGLSLSKRLFIIVGLISVLSVSSVMLALAATNVSFSGQTPAQGASVSISKPAIGVTVATSDGLLDLSGVQMTLDNVPVTPTLTTDAAGKFIIRYIPTTALANGTHAVSVSVWDSALGTSKSTTWSFTVDAAPVISALRPVDKAVIETAAPKISVSVIDKNDNLTGATMKIDSSPVAAELKYRQVWVGDEEGNGYFQTDPKQGALEYQASGLADTTHTVEVTVTDARGDSATKSWTFTVATKPTFSNFLPAQNSTVQSAPRLEVKVTESQLAANTIVVKDNGSTLAHNYDASTNIISVDKNFAYGTHQITVSASDTNGYSGSAAWTFIVDNQAPAINVTSPTITNNNVSITNGGLSFSAVLTDISDITGATVLKLDDQAVNADIGFEAQHDYYTGEIIGYNKKVVNVKYSAVVPDGNHTLSLTRGDVAGNTQTQTWNLNVNVKPVISQAAPLNFISLLKPDISANIKDGNNSISAADIKLIVDGNSVTPIYDPVTGNLLYKPSDSLANEAYHNVTVSVYNEAALSTTYSWKFYTSTFADMADADMVNCSACHTYSPDASIPFQDIHKNKLPFSGDHGVREKCNACHNVISKPADCIQCHSLGGAPGSAPHGSTPTLSYSLTNYDQSTPFRVLQNRELFDCIICHQPGSPVRGYKVGDLDQTPTRVLNNHDIPELHKTGKSSCNDCHAQSLTREHAREGRVDKNGQLITCNTCHKSSDPVVKGAIANKQKECSSCHGALTSAHLDSHQENVFSTEPAANDRCVSCHESSNLAAIHVDKTNNITGKAMTCDSCHGASADPVVKAAVSAGTGTQCATCHNTNVTSPGVKPVHAMSDHEPDSFITNEYPGKDASTCTLCHTSKKLDLIHTGTAAKSGNTMNCNTCHGASAAPTVKDAVTAKNNNCNACHNLVQHTDKSVTSAVYHTKDIFINLPDVDCTGCHTSSITLEHFKASSTFNGGPDPVTCDSCHASPDLTVQVAISTDNTRCDACHSYPTALHQPEHITANYTSDPARTEDCTVCHTTKNIESIHVNKLNKKTGELMTCNSCHGSSADSIVKTAVIAGIPTDCSTCHNSNAATTGLMPIHSPADHEPDSLTTAAYTGNDAATCTLCHTSKKLDVIHTGTSSKSGNAMNCQTCHGDTASQTVKDVVASKDNNCSACHNLAQHTDKSVTSAVYHDKAVFISQPDVNCSSCHTTSMTSEHFKGTSTINGGAAPVTCDTCHASADTKVQTAISQKNTKCDACHTYPPELHKPSHATSVYTSDTSRTDDCSMCHAKTLKEEHVGKINTAGSVMNCNICHASNDTKVITAISSKTTTSCEACHTLHPEKDVTQLHDSVNFTNNTYTDTNMNCSKCHASSISTEHINKTTEAGLSMNCDTCHKSSRTDVQNAIANKNPKCEACHTKVHTSTTPYHATTFVVNKTLSCEKCHNPNSISDDHLKFKTSTGVQITCDTCHKSTNPTVLNAIKTGNTGCDTCHTTRHSDVQTPHKVTFIPNTTYNCSICHLSANIGFNQTVSYHKISGITPTTNTLNGGTFVSPWTSTSNLNCRDCHNKNTSTSTYYGKLLRGQYTSTTGKQGYSTSNQLCFYCHPTSTYGSSSSNSTNSGFKRDSYSSGSNLHAYDHHGEVGCTGCHSKKPHSGNTKHMIVIRSTTEPDSKISRFSHSTTYSESSCSTYSGCH